ncbi:cytochrome b-c1 complex subunit 8 [Panulirus ornatus]|uniref:cytochrome b-c1 complex subunit 8 n=1 Tax=Panulirus ornatus TaxID=150431 RepID=UPI003A84A5BA
MLFISLISIGEMFLLHCLSFDLAVSCSSTGVSSEVVNKMGKGFGELAYVRGIIKYSISPFEQRAFAGALRYGVPNLFRRFRTQVLRVVPPFLVAYMVYSGIEKKHEQLMRKNPADYEKDE